MKLHLPKRLLTALLTAVCASASHADDSASLTLGDVMYVGDSITHGVNSASYRWALHKIFVDNGVGYTEVGYTSGNHTDDNGKDDFNPSSTNSYRGVVFQNVHSAAASQRAYNTAGRADTERLDHTSIQNWLGVSTVDGVAPTKKMNGEDYTGSVNTPNTFVLMLGTNDLLSDPSGSSDYIATPENLTTRMNALLGVDRVSGDMGTIVDTMYKANADATVYVSTIPCWANHTNNNADATREAVNTYNTALKNWANNYNSKNKTNIVVMDVNRGLVDVTKSSFYGVSDMFNAADGHSFISGDMLHPNAQGDLIIAGNMARAMGISGRTAGAERKAAEDFQKHWILNTINAGQYTWNASANGCTAELQGFTLGNGATDGWNTTDNFSFTMANGSVAGTLNINEGYIQWGGSVIFSSAQTNAVLFSADMSTLNENIRMAYINEDSANNIAAGFYVWLGDMLIGEALQGSTSTQNGVYISYNDKITHSLTLFAMDSNGAYAPTVSSYLLSDAPAATAQGVVTVPTGVPVVNGDTSEANKLYANKGEHTEDVWCRVSSGQYSAWTGAHTGGTLEGNVTMIFDGAYKGTGTAFGIVNGSEVTGNVILQFDAADAVYGSWTNTVADYASVVGSYSGAIDGTFKVVINAGAFQYDILGGSYNGSSIGGTDIYINGGSVGRNVYGGSQKGTVGSTSVTITGGYVQGNVYGGGRGNDDANKITGSTSVTITGGTINGDIYAGGSGGTIGGDTALTIDGNLPTLHGDLLSAGGSAGTITGNATLTIKNATANNYIASIDKFTGTLSGGENVDGTSTLVFENTQLSGTAFNSVTVEHFDTINLTNGSNVTLGATALDGANGSTISLTGDSHLTVGGNFSSTAGLNITGGSGSVTLAGQTNTFGGGISVAEGNTLTLSGDLAFNIEDGDFDVSYTYDTTRTTNGLGDVTVRVSGLEHLFSVEGSLNTDAVDIVTVNGSVVDINALASESATYTKEDVVYYVMGPMTDEIENTTSNTTDSNYIYRLSPTEVVKMTSVVNVGKNNHGDGPTPYSIADNAEGYYIGENGILCISADTTSAGVTVQSILANTQGSGDIILRAPGYNDNDSQDTQTRWDITFDGVSQLTGNLYLSPYVQLETSGAYRYQNGIDLYLNDGADISSFNSIVLGYPYTIIHAKGTLGQDEDGNHLNNVTAFGSGDVFIYYESAEKQELVLGGNTTLQPYKYLEAAYANAGASLHLTAYTDVDFRIRHLTSGEDTNSERPTSVRLGMGATEVDSVLTIESFDFDGSIYLDAQARFNGSLKADITLLEGQKLKDSQLIKTYPSNSTVATLSAVLKGKGTYILSDGHSMTYSSFSSFANGAYNFGVLDSNWTGTVEVNNLDATIDAIQGIKIADYGNENSTIHFKGFTGYLKDSTTTVEIKPDLILENTYKEDGSFNMNAYEITGGYEGQDQTYKGNISGTGDFVVSADENMTFNLQGDLSEWKDGAELKVTAGTQAVNFSDAATVINADVLATNGATMNADISNTKAVTVNGKVKADGGTLNLSVNTEQGTTFTNEVKVTKISVGSDSTVKLEAASSAGNINIGSYGEGKVATLSDGLTIEENTVGHGYIADAMISHIQQAGTVELVEVSASNLYLYGNQVQFHSTDSTNQFKFDKQIPYGSERVNEVVFTSDIFSGMILSKDGAQLTLTVDNAVVWGDAVQPDWTNVTIKLEGFTIEQLAGTAGDWDWDKFGLSFEPNSASVATLDNAALSTTVSDLLNDKYEFVKYEQSADGLIIRMYNTPEPTTATLSMLALAALAARRRRASR